MGCRIIVELAFEEDRSTSMDMSEDRARWNVPADQVATEDVRPTLSRRAVRRSPIA